MPTFLLSPFAWRAFQLGALAAMTYYASRRGTDPKDAGHEEMLDSLPDGVAAHGHRAEAERAVHAAGRFRRVFRFGPQGPGVEIDAAGLGRVRLRRAN